MFQMLQRESLTLVPQDSIRLQTFVDRGENLKEREGVRKLIFSDTGQSMSITSAAVGVDLRTDGLTRMDWLRPGAQPRVDFLACVCD